MTKTFTYFRGQKTILPHHGITFWRRFHLSTIHLDSENLHFYAKKRDKNDPEESSFLKEHLNCIVPIN